MSQTNETEITLRDLRDSFRRSRWLVLFITALASAISAAVVWIVPTKYEASTVVFAVSSDSSNGTLGGLSSLASQFGGLAALAGVTPQTDSKKAESLAVLQSEEITQLYIRDNDLLPILYPKKWNSVEKRWKVSGAQIPTLWKGSYLFRKSIRSISTDTKTGMVTLSIKWNDPATAAKWANGLIQLENGYLRQKAIRESETNIAYLSEQAGKSDVVGIKQAIYALMQNEINKEMLARGSEEYALKVVDPAFVPEKPAYPTPVLWITIGTLFGLFLSIFVVYIKNEKDD